jgi:hypothetical protein
LGKRRGGSGGKKTQGREVLSVSEKFGCVKSVPLVIIAKILSQKVFKNGGTHALRLQRKDLARGFDKRFVDGGRAE